MYLPQAAYPRTRNKESKRIDPKIIQFAGYNANPIINSGQLKGMSNCSSRNFPCISNRLPRTQHTTVTTPNAIYSANNKLCWVDGTSFYYDGVSKGTVTSGAKSIVDFNGKILIFPDKKYYDYGTNTFGTLGTGTYPAAGAVPDMDYICIHSNRVFGCKGSDIYASKLGDCTNWTTFAGENTDSYATDVASEGNFTGIASYANHVVFFKKDCIHELYGDVPYQFTVKEVAKKGCIDGKSVVEVNGLLYFLARDGINLYGGGLPRLVSHELNDTFTTASAGTDGNTYYVCLYNGTSYNVYAYDTYHGVWHKEDTLRVVEFTLLDGYVYALTSETTSKIMKLNYGTETVTGYAETEIFDESELNKKYYSKLKVKVELGTSASIDIYVKTDNGAYSLVKSFSTTQLQVIPIEFIPKRCNNFQVKFAFSGDVKIFGMEREFELATDL